MKTAVIYCRVSTDEQVKNTSLGQQEKDCRAYCQRNDLKVLELFRDEGETARVADRPEFQRLFFYISQNHVDAVIVWKLDRFARNNYDQAVYFKQLAESGSDIHSVTEKLDNTPAGKLMKNMLGSINQFYSDINSERSRHLMKEVALSGYWTHKAPLGYKMVRVNNKPSLQMDPDNGPAMYELFSRIATGMMRVMDAAPWLSNKLGKTIYPQAIHAMLRSPIYAGIIQNKLTDYQPVKAAFKGIVTQNTYDQVQSILSQGARHQQERLSSEFPLRGVLKCSECGRALTASKSKGYTGKLYAYYHCRCGVRIQVSKVQAMFETYLDGLSSYMSFIMPLFRSIMMEGYEQDHAQAIAERERAMKQLKALEDKRARLLNLYLAGGIDETGYKIKLTELGAGETIARVIAHDAETDKINAESMMLTFERIFKDLKTLLCRTADSSRLALIKAIFGGDLTVSPTGEVSNCNKDNLINILQKTNTPSLNLVPLTGIDSNSVISYVKSFHAFARIIAA